MEKIRDSIKRFGGDDNCESIAFVARWLIGEVSLSFWSLLMENVLSFVGSLSFSEEFILLSI